MLSLNEAISGLMVIWHENYFDVEGLVEVLSDVELKCDDFELDTHSEV